MAHSFGKQYFKYHPVDFDEILKEY